MTSREWSFHFPHADCAAVAHPELERGGGTSDSRPHRVRDSTVHALLSLTLRYNVFQRNCQNATICIKQFQKNPWNKTLSVTDPNGPHSSGSLHPRQEISVTACVSRHSSDRTANNIKRCCVCVCLSVCLFDVYTSAGASSASPCVQVVIRRRPGRPEAVCSYRPLTDVMPAQCPPPSFSCSAHDAQSLA